MKNILIWVKGLLSRRTRKLLQAQQCGCYNRHEYVIDKEMIIPSHPILGLVIYNMGGGLFLPVGLSVMREAKKALTD